MLSTFMPTANVNLPESIDWRENGTVTEVRDQGTCGSCYIMAAIESLEGQYFRKTGKLKKFSPQNIIDCDDLNDGCNGGYTMLAFVYIVQNGVELEENYPYEMAKHVCRHNVTRSAVNIAGFVELPEGDENLLVHAIATIGPIVVSMQSAHESLQFYSSGIYFEPKCDQRKGVDHKLSAVGYGKDGPGKDYFILKNSWSSGWGDNGYLKVARNRNNHCGIADDSYFPLLQ